MVIPIHHIFNQVMKLLTNFIKNIVKIKILMSLLIKLRHNHNVTNFDLFLYDVVW